MSIAAIDTTLLLRVLYTAFAAGVGASLVFSLAVYGLVRSNDMRREHRSLAAAGFALLGVVAVLLTVALVVFGLILLARKS
jgi:predicted membrane channel-forming protein YqfA (hemolysin III family)